jgi:hypothetical protein
MRMSCGRSDGESANQAREIPRTRGSSRRAHSQSNYYNRLEYCRWFRLLYAATRSILRLLAALPHPSGLVAPGTPIRLAKSEAFLSLVQGRQSCHQQLWGVTPFRRGIA